MLFVYFGIRALGTEARPLPNIDLIQRCGGPNFEMQKSPELEAGRCAPARVHH
jgi:hypothetical protein